MSALSSHPLTPQSQLEKNALSQYESDVAILKTKLKAENDDKMKKVREEMVMQHNKQMAALKSELETLQAKEKQGLASDVNAAKARAGEADVLRGWLIWFS